MRPLSLVALPPEVVTLRFRGGWARVRGFITIITEVSLVPGERRDLVGDGKVGRGDNVAGSSVDEYISAAEARTYNGGVFPFSDSIVRG